MPSSCSQKGTIHFSNQHQPVKKCAAEKNLSSKTKHSSKNGSWNTSKDLNIERKVCTHGVLNCTMFCSRISVTYILIWKENYFLSLSYAHNLIHSLIASFIHSTINTTVTHFQLMYIFQQSLSLCNSLSIIYIYRQFLTHLLALFSVYRQPVNGVCLLYQNSIMGSIQASQTLPYSITFSIPSKEQ